jgi:hypothetical protein
LGIDGATVTRLVKQLESEELVAELRAAHRIFQERLLADMHRGQPAPHETPQMIMEIFRVESGRVAEIWGAGTPPRAKA